MNNTKSDQYDFFDVFPTEVIIEIFKNFPLTELLKMELLNKFFNELIRSFRWNHFTVKLNNIKFIEYVIKNYKFANYDFSNSLITDERNYNKQSLL
jgi:hypothetical protein